MTDEQRLQHITEMLILVRDNLFRGMSKSIQKLQAKSINETLGLQNFTESPQRPWVGLTDEELIGIKKDAERYRWLRKEYAESRETYLAECVPSENALDEYIDRQMAKTSIKTERWSGK